MTAVTRLLTQIEQGDRSATDELLPLVYDELRKLAECRLTHERPGQTLQATALVHEAYLRLVGGKTAPHWNSRGHFFAAAAEAMRRILVESARRKGRQKHGGDFARHDLPAETLLCSAPDDELMAVHEALGGLAAVDERAAELVKLRYFAGFTIDEVADCLGISPRKANQVWAYARAWLAAEVKREAPRAANADADR